MNKVELIGRTTSDIELRNAGDVVVTNFTLAVNRYSKNGSTTDFIRCVAFGKLAETLSTYVKKGNQVGITGSIKTGSYEDKDGKKVYTTDVMVDGISLLGSRSDNNNDNNGGFNEIPDIKKDEIPF